MDTRTRFTLVLFVAVAALAGFLITTGTEDKPITQITITDISPDSIENIRIERSGKAPILFSRQDKIWRMTSPLEISANPARINAMLRMLRAPSLAQLDAANINLAALQLEIADTILYLNNFSFIFGNTEALDDRRYVRFKNTIHLVNDSLYHQLLQGPEFFVSPRLLPEGLSLTEIEFPDYRLHKQFDNWLVFPPGELTPEQTVELLKSWRQAEAIRVGIYSVSEAFGNIKISADPGHTIIFNIAATEPNLILARNDLGIEYHLSKQTGNQLLPKKMEIPENE